MTISEIEYFKRRGAEFRIKLTSFVRTAKYRGPVWQLIVLTKQMKTRPNFWWVRTVFQDPSKERVMAYAAKRLMGYTNLSVMEDDKEPQRITL